MPLLVLAPALSAAPPELKYLFPAGGQVGTTFEIESKGKFASWPAKIWVDRAGLSIVPKTEKEKLAAAIAPDAQPGLYWVRLYDDEGAAPPFPILAGHLPEVVEQEPNDQPKKPQTLSTSNCVVNGRLSRRGDVDTYAVNLAAGQTLVAEIDANRSLETPLDGLLEIVSTDGFVLARNDDALGLDPRVIYIAPRAGVYLVRAYGFPATPDSTIGFAGNEAYLYRLTVATDGFIDHPWPLAAGPELGPVQLVGWNLPASLPTLAPQATPDPLRAVLANPALANWQFVPVARHASILAEPVATTSASAPASPGDQRISLPVTISGRLARPREAQTFSFEGQAGTTVAFRIESQMLGFPLDPVLELFDAAGKSLVRVDDTQGRDAELTFAIPADGVYRLTVSDLHRAGGPRHVYRLNATLPQPEVRLSLAAESFVVAAGGQLEIPVKLERLQGFNQPVTVRVEGLPPGASCAEVVSPVDGDLAKEIKLTLQAGDQTASGPIAVAGIVAGAAGEPVRAAAPIAGRTVKTSSPWLTITAAAVADKP